MAKHSCQVQRKLLPTVYAQKRWDKAYQLLLQCSLAVEQSQAVPTSSDSIQSPQSKESEAEVNNANQAKNCGLC